MIEGLMEGLEPQSEKDWQPPGGKELAYEEFRKAKAVREGLVDQRRKYVDWLRKGARK